MIKFHPGDLCACDIALTTREGSYGERIPGWTSAKEIDVPPLTLMIILFTCEAITCALALTRIGYVWVYIHELIE